MQEFALEDGNSYFEPQDNLAGEMFDNTIRIKFLKQENSKYDGQYDDDELKNIAKDRYANDKDELTKKKNDLSESSGATDNLEEE